MISELTAVYQAAKAGVELVRNALGAKVDHDVDAALLGVNDHLLRLQTLALGLQGEVARLNQASTEAAQRESALKEEIAQLRKFDAECPAYTLQQVGPGAFAYCYQGPPANGGAQSPQSDAWFCPQCFDQRRKSILQYAGYQAGDRLFNCAHCGCSIRVKDAETGIGVVSRGRRRSITDGY